jgi:hypothetical protein
MFFSPLEVFMGNANEFVFSLGQIWWILFLVSLGGAAALTLIALALPKTASLIWNMFIFSLGICCYVQSAFLNSSMTSLTGENALYSKSTVYINLIIWVFIIIGVITASLILKKFKKLTEKILKKCGKGVDKLNPL